ncbi:hypothetical protein [Streptomyces uncialis]|uniref:Minor tail protein n=1 Tax=Streptomyces uncialis TaxID=1048205 RepID=A0A1Q4VC14_9ACTN|nr:hypothetical protein [Streptomyces uncialis]OKH95412.1 hypothetical protein AB852_00650 [Streptomyces uncialis]
MAEISYPFNSSNGSGGTELVSQVQWQAMAGMWGGDRVDLTLASESYGPGALPFAARVLNGRTVEIQAGRAWVGGFYYQLTAAETVAIESNPTDRARKDTIVLRTDVVKGSVNLAAVKGQPSASPIAPRPQRNPGQVWEMVLYEVDVPPKDGAISPSWRGGFKLPPPIALPWNVRPAAEFTPVGTFLYDMDNNGGDTQYEAYVGRDGYVVTQHLGKSRDYSPKLINVSGLPSSGISYSGRWRYISPNMVFFSVLIENKTKKNYSTSNATSLGVTLPVTANGVTGQVLSGMLRNPGYQMDYPNMMDLTAYISPGKNSGHVGLYSPNRTTTKEGLDNHKVFPAGSAIHVSGTYEANTFSE